MAKQLLWLACLALVAGTAAARGEFLGTESCSGCHARELRAWQGSHHDLAMQHAGPDSVLGDFDEAEFTYGGVTSRFFRRDARYFVRTDGADGEPAQFEIRYTFGVAPLQQYLIEFADGRLQALGIAWDSRPRSAGGQRWLHLYPAGQVDHRHELHWTRPRQNWNYMCADCHSTNVQKNYDARADRFDTTWTDIDVGCEACHGPGGDHLAWAAKAPAARATDARKGFAVTLPRARERPWKIDPATGSAEPMPGSASERDIEVCADCHSRRSSLAPAPETDARFLNHFMPALLTRGLYHPDGQIADEVYVWGSFIQSRMHRAGVGCSDCHDPHGLRLHAPGDALCARCHLPAKFATETHHHHAPGSAGARCVECHMPETTYMVVDPRRDHSIRIPRPDESVVFGTPNACNRCHEDRSAEWAAEHRARWYPEAKPGHQTWTAAFAAARVGDPAAESMLLGVYRDTGAPDIARATALLELRPFLSPASGGALRQGVDDASPLVRIAALRTLEVLPPQHRYAVAAKLLEDPLRAVRVEAGRVLAAVPEQPLSPAQRGQLRRAVEEYVDTRRYHADRADARTNLGNLLRERGDLAQAEEEYTAAIRLDPTFSPAYVNLADLYRDRAMDDAAAGVLREGIERRPDAAALHHAMGLLQVRAGNADAAVAALAEAARLAPDDARFAYVYGVALNSTGKPARGLEVLADALDRHPYDRDILFALATINRDRGDLEAARRHARRMLDLRPGDRQARALARSLN